MQKENGNFLCRYNLRFEFNVSDGITCSLCVIGHFLPSYPSSCSQYLGGSLRTVPIHSDIVVPLLQEAQGSFTREKYHLHGEAVAPSPYRGRSTNPGTPPSLGPQVGRVEITRSNRDISSRLTRVPVPVLEGGFFKDSSYPFFIRFEPAEAGQATTPHLDFPREFL